jgi:alkylation response protein AidB-like acyl-CoA dehydrogenase
MIDFSEPEAHQILRKTVRDFAEREVRPHARAWDEEERFPTELVPKLAELGLLGMRVPEQYGGADMSTEEVVVVIEELARVDGSTALSVAAHNGLCTGHILLAGNDAQKQKYLPALATGKALGAWGLTEPGSGSDAAGARTRAVKQPDGTWLLNGSKTFITFGSLASTYVVMAVTTPEKKQRGLTAFILEKGMPGFTVGKHIEKLGCRSSDTTELLFENVAVPPENQLGALDNGFLDTLEILDRGRISIAAMALGLGEGALAAARKYAKERVQFGRPIGENQAIQWMLADSATELAAAARGLPRPGGCKEKGASSSPPRRRCAPAIAPSRSTAGTATRASSPSSARCVIAS